MFSPEITKGTDCLICVWLSCSESAIDKLLEDAKCDLLKTAWDLEFKDAAAWVPLETETEMKIDM